MDRAQLVHARQHARFGHGGAIVGAADDNGSFFYQPSPAATLLGSAIVGASVYHGYTRNVATSPIGWGLIWGLLGAFFPIPTIAIALAQGFGKKA